MSRGMVPLEALPGHAARREPARVSPGTAVFMTSNLGVVPPVLLHHFKHNKVLHEQVILLYVVTENVPQVRARGARRRRGPGRRALLGGRPLRLHGDPERAAGDQAVPRPGAAGAHERGELLPRPRDAADRPAGRHGGLAQVALRLPLAQRPAGHRLLRASRPTASSSSACRSSSSPAAHSCSPRSARPATRPRAGRRCGSVP